MQMSNARLDPFSSVYFSTWSRKAFSFFALSFLFYCLPCEAQTQKIQQKKLIVVIDPGHGGNDVGAKATTTDKNVVTEKDFTLLLAKDLARELTILGHKPILTRTQDVYMDLSERTAFANRMKADLFISIHFNSTPEANGGNNQIDSSLTTGIESYILNHATDAASRRLADLENSVLKDSRVKEQVQSNNVSLIMKDLILDANLEPSRALACAIQNRVKLTAKDRGVKQALFYVLLGADMPSILIEAGFMNSIRDRNRIMKTPERLKLASQLASAVEDYRGKKNSTQCKIQTGL